MELTYNLPTKEWYAPSKNNDINWWKIDYPPSSAYISWLFGVLSHYFDPKSMELLTSRGYETPEHKFFMRATVLVSDILFLMSAFIAFISYDAKKYNWQTKCVFLVLILLSPPLILVDHGHFQYNCIMSGKIFFWVKFCLITLLLFRTNSLGNVFLRQKGHLGRWCTICCRFDSQANGSLLLDSILCFHPGKNIFDVRLK